MINTLHVGITHAINLTVDGRLTVPSVSSAFPGFADMPPVTCYEHRRIPANRGAVGPGTIPLCNISVIASEVYDSQFANGTNIHTNGMRCRRR